MITTITAPTATRTADMLMDLSRMGGCTDIGGPGATGDPAPGGSGGPGGAAGRSTNAPDGPGDCGAGGCDQPLESALPGTGGGGEASGGSGRRGGVGSGGGWSWSLIPATPMPG